MATLCVNCGQEVTNETAGSVAPACDECRARWRAAEIQKAIVLLRQAGYTVREPLQTERLEDGTIIVTDPRFNPPAAGSPLPAPAGVVPHTTRPG